MRVDGNLIQGNLAGAGDGGGIRTESNLPGDLIAIVNNLIVNNVAGLAGGGISMQDTANVRIHHDTVAHNDSTATAGAAFADPNQSTPQPAGIVAREHSLRLPDPHRRHLLQPLAGQHHRLAEPLLLLLHRPGRTR